MVWSVGKVVTAHVFFVSRTHAQPTLRRVAWRSAQCIKTCFTGVFPLVILTRRLTAPHFTANMRSDNPFSVGRFGLELNIVLIENISYSIS